MKRREEMKQVSIKGIVIFSLLFFVAVMSGPQAGMCAGEKIIMRAAHASPPNPEYTWDFGLGFIEKRVERLTNGKVDVKIYSGTLGGERQLLEGVQMGTLECSATSTIPWSGFVKEMGIVTLPYLFNDFDHMFNVLDGALGDKFKAIALNKGFRILGWWKLAPKTTFTTDKPVEKLEDFKGLRIRCGESPEFIGLYKAFGAIPVPMPWPETYSALQQGIVDGVDGDWGSCLAAHHYEVVKYGIEVNHVLITGALTVSEKWFKKLPDDIKMAIVQAAHESQPIVRKHDYIFQASCKKQMIAKGLKCFEPTDYTPFREAVRPMYPQFYDKVGKENIEWVQRVGMEID
jgi:tripartite ATP-independent transporter DctP family solute receptor